MNGSWCFDDSQICLEDSVKAEFLVKFGFPGFRTRVQSSKSLVLLIHSNTAQKRRSRTSWHRSVRRMQVYPEWSWQALQLLAAISLENFAIYLTFLHRQPLQCHAGGTNYHFFLSLFGWWKNQYIQSGRWRHYYPLGPKRLFRTVAHLTPWQSLLVIWWWWTRLYFKLETVYCDNVRPMANLSFSTTGVKTRMVWPQYPLVIQIGTRAKKMSMNADGEWLSCPTALPSLQRWQYLDSAVCNVSSSFTSFWCAHSWQRPCRLAIDYEIQIAQHWPFSSHCHVSEYHGVLTAVSTPGSVATTQMNSSSTTSSVNVTSSSQMTSGSTNMISSDSQMMIDQATRQQQQQQQQQQVEDSPALRLCSLSFVCCRSPYLFFY